MRRLRIWFLAFGITCTTGCSFADFWSSIAGVANGGNGYRSDYEINRDSEFQDRYRQQSALAREYGANSPD
jgi:hypothetical protein